MFVVSNKHKRQQTRHSVKLKKLMCVFIGTVHSESTPFCSVHTVLQVGQRLE